PAPDPGTPEPPLWSHHRTMLTAALEEAATYHPIQPRDTAAVEELVRCGTPTVATVTAWLQRRIPVLHEPDPDAEE
ncbi:hypothetical protein H3146_24390, partial [Streptomyces sp. OF3]